MFYIWAKTQNYVRKHSKLLSFVDLADLQLYKNANRSLRFFFDTNFTCPTAAIFKQSAQICLPQVCAPRRLLAR